MSSLPRSPSRVIPEKTKGWKELENVLKERAPGWEGAAEKLFTKLSRDFTPAPLHGDHKGAVKDHTDFSHRDPLARRAKRAIERFKKSVGSDAEGTSSAIRMVHAQISVNNEMGCVASSASNQLRDRLRVEPYIDYCRTKGVDVCDVKAAESFLADSKKLSAKNAATLAADADHPYTDTPESLMKNTVHYQQEAVDIAVKMIEKGEICTDKQMKKYRKLTTEEKAALTEVLADVDSVKIKDGLSIVDLNKEKIEQANPAVLKKVKALRTAIESEEQASKVLSAASEAASASKSVVATVIHDQKQHEAATKAKADALFQQRRALEQTRNDEEHRERQQQQNMHVANRTQPVQRSPRSSREYERETDRPQFDPHPRQPRSTPWLPAPREPPAWVTPSPAPWPNPGPGPMPNPVPTPTPSMPPQEWNQAFRTGSPGWEAAHALAKQDGIAFKDARRQIWHGGLKHGSLPDF